MGPNAAELAELMVDPMFAKSVAAASTYSGDAITYDIRLPQLASTSFALPRTNSAQSDGNAVTGSAEAFSADEAVNSGLGPGTIRRTRLSCHPSRLGAHSPIKTAATATITIVEACMAVRNAALLTSARSLPCGPS